VHEIIKYGLQLVQEGLYDTLSVEPMGKLSREGHMARLILVGHFDHRWDLRGEM